MKITVITVCLNSVDTIERAIKSVLEQNYSELEYIVIDGKSVDGTIEIIKKYSERIAFFCSEKDAGIYDAMNKGILHATGEMIVFLNSDDWFVSGTLQKIATVYGQEEDDVIYGNINMIYSDGSLVSKNTCIQNKSNWYYRVPICHQAEYVKRDVYERIGKFNLKYKYAADFEWLLRCHYAGIRFRYVDATLCNYSLGGMSNQYMWRGMQEMQEAVHEYILEEDKGYLQEIDIFYNKMIKQHKGEYVLNNILQTGYGVDIYRKKIQDFLKNMQIVYIFGAGYDGKECIKWLEFAEIEIRALIDNNIDIVGDSIQGYQIMSLNEIEDKKTDIIIATSLFEVEIRSQLKTNGFYNIHSFYDLQVEVGKDV